jgi:hypothetical protein
LEWAEYARDGSYRHEKIAGPSWEQIEQAIRRLDKDRYPCVWLWATEDESRHAIDGSAELLEVMGGNGEDWLAGSFKITRATGHWAPAARSRACETRYDPRTTPTTQVVVLLAGLRRELVRGL